MNRLAQAAGLVETKASGRPMGRPEVWHQSARGACQRGIVCRYARVDLGIRILKDLTRLGENVRPETLRSGQLDFSATAFPPNTSNGRNGNVAFKFRHSVRSETCPP